jgi:hypothetical protein
MLLVAHAKTVSGNWFDPNFFIIAEHIEFLGADAQDLTQRSRKA